MKFKYSLLALIIPLLLSGCNFGNDNNQLVYTGTVESDKVDLKSEIPDKINKVFVKEGEKVKKGMTLIEINTKALELDLKKLEASLTLSQAKLADLCNGSRKEEILQAEANLKNIASLQTNAGDDYAYRLENFNRLQELYTQGAISKQQLDDAQALLDRATATVVSFEQQYKAAQAQLDLRLNGPTEKQIQMAQSEVDIKKAEIMRLKHTIDRGKIISPIDGIVQSLNYQEGELVGAGSNIATLTAMDNLWIKIFVPEKMLHKVSLGQTVPLSLPATENDTLTGEIIYISSEAEFTPKNVESKENKQEMVFAVKIRINDHKHPIKPGMLIDVQLDGEL